MQTLPLIITILGCGTSTGVPLAGCSCPVCLSTDPKNNRLRTSAWVHSASQDISIVLDVGPDFRAQALRAGIQRLDAALFTHSHADHILGIDDLRPFNFVRRAAIPCYALPETIVDIKRIFSYAFQRDMLYAGGAPPSLDMHEMKLDVPFSVEGITVLPLRVQHGPMTVAGFRIGDLAYLTDCNMVPHQTREAIRGVRTLIIDGLRHEPHNTHLTISEACAIAREVGAQQTYLTHLTHTVDYQATSAELPEGVALAYDGLAVSFSID